MTPRDVPESPVRKADIFREQALQAWRGQEAEERVLLDLSPSWMRWAFAGIFILAGVGVLLAATTSIPKRATITASARLSAGRDSVLVDAVFVMQRDASIRVGETMLFRPQDSGIAPIDLTILTVAPYSTNTGVPASTSLSSSKRVLVRAGTPTSRIDGDALSFTGPAASGSAQVLIGEESLLHLVRPRTPAGMKP